MSIQEARRIMQLFSGRVSTLSSYEKFLLIKAIQTLAGNLRGNN